jgi:hypothetical protein
MEQGSRNEVVKQNQSDRSKVHATANSMQITALHDPPERSRTTRSEAIWTASKSEDGNKVEGQRAQRQRPCNM